MRNLPVIRDAAKLTAGLEDVAKQRVKFEQKLHQLAVSAVVMAEEHGRWQFAVDLVEKALIAHDADGKAAKGSVVRRQALVKWLVELGPFSFKLAAGERSPKLRFDPDKRTTTHGAVIDADFLATLQAQPFWLYQPEKLEAEVNIDQAIAQLIKRAAAAAAKGRLTGNTGALADLRSFAVAHDIELAA